MDDRKRIALENSCNASGNCLKSIESSLSIASHTKADLTVQAEQLNNVERNLNQIDEDLNTSAKHITALKSVFGSIFNFFKVDNSSSKSSPTNEIDNRSISDRSSYSNSQENYNFSHTIDAPCTSMGAVNGEEKINRNLTDIEVGITKMKSAALDLNYEIERQNEQLERIQQKSESTDIRLKAQNRQIVNILN